MASTVKAKLDIPNQDNGTVNIDLEKYDAQMKKIKNDLTNINKTLKEIKKVYKELEDDSKSKGKFKKSINAVVTGVQKKVNAHNTLKNSLEASLTRSLVEYSRALNKKTIEQQAAELGNVQNVLDESNNTISSLSESISLKDAEIEQLKGDIYTISGDSELDKKRIEELERRLRRLEGNEDEFGLNPKVSPEEYNKVFKEKYGVDATAENQQLIKSYLQNEDGNNDLLAQKISEEGGIEGYNKRYMPLQFEDNNRDGYDVKLATLRDQEGLDSLGLPIKSTKEQYAKSFERKYHMEYNEENFNKVNEYVPASVENKPIGLVHPKVTYFGKELGNSSSAADYQQKFEQKYGMPWSTENEDKVYEQHLADAFKQKYNLEYTDENRKMVLENEKNIYEKYKATYRGDVILDRSKFPNPIPLATPSTDRPVAYSKKDDPLNSIIEENYKRTKELEKMASSMNLNDVRTREIPTNSPISDHGVVMPTRPEEWYRKNKGTF